MFRISISLFGFCLLCCVHRIPEAEASLQRRALPGGQVIDPTKAQPLEKQNEVDQCSPPTGECDAKSIYRTIDGSCNNLKHATWGMANTAHVRLMTATYADGKSKYRTSVVNDTELPSPRLLSTLLFKDGPSTDIHTRAFLTFAQIMAHDVTSNPESPGGPCCNEGGMGMVEPQPDVCRPISIPLDDAYYKPFNRSCLEYRTSLPIKCPLAQPQAIVLNSHYLDGSVLYASGDKKAKSLRTMEGGKLLVLNKSGNPFLPPFQDLPVATSKTECPLDPNNCMDSGDPRVNQNLDLVATTLAMYRFHNLLTDKLALVKVNASDEELYQVTRKIMSSVLQHITYNDMAPILLGKEYAASAGLTPEPGAFSKTYSPDVNPSTLADIAGSALRSLHTLIPSKIDFVTENRTVSKTIAFSAGLHNPGPTFSTKDAIDDLLRGQATQLQGKADELITEEITNKFFDSDVPGNSNTKFGDDLTSRDIQRGRDMGLAPYQDYRELCGLDRAKTFDDFKDTIGPANLDILKQVYASPDDVDYYVGAFSENFLPGTLTTPTFRCVIAEALKRYKDGDRFFYTHGDQPGSLTIDQIKVVQSITLGQILCGGSNGIEKMQPNPFLPAGSGNALTPCADMLAAIDLTAFK